MQRSFIAILVLLIATLAREAYSQMGAPSPELKKLDFLSGNWTADGTINPGPSMPGGKFTMTIHAEWLDGNFFLVEHSDGDLGAMGKLKELAIMGYDSEKKVYTYHAFNSAGQAETATGTIDGDTWTWTSDEHFNGMTMKGRYTMKVLSPTSYTMKFELSQDGNSWTTNMEGKATKK